jgi:dTDP-L-rhamnose 4-epimerase
VVHLAAETGTGQSYDEVSRYCDVNVTGTARLIEAIRRFGSDVRRVVLASSRAVYGEGPYRYRDGRIALAASRSIERMQRGDFEVRCPDTDVALEPVPVSGIYGVAPASVYGSTKLMQEYLLSQSAQSAPWTVAVLRLQNVFGPGQSLRNPYTGVLSIFCAQLLGGTGIDVYEDGAITRDFVFVDDVVDALVRASEVERVVPFLPIDIGSAEPCTIFNAARHLVRFLAVDPSRIAVTGRFRAGDVRFAAADITEARRALDWQPKVPLEEGLRRLSEWSARSFHL